MFKHTDALIQLATELFSADEWATLRRISATSPLDRRGLADFDDSLGGPSMRRIADSRTGDGTLGIPGHGVGRYETDDRDVFRPLQYCAVHLGSRAGNEEWLTREVVEMGGLHLEGLVKRIGGLRFVPLGQGLRRARVRRNLEAATADQLDRYARVHNAAKHGLDHDGNTHMFSMQDAVLAYAISRRLGQHLYTLAKVVTDWR